MTIEEKLLKLLEERPLERKGDKKLIQNTDIEFIDTIRSGLYPHINLCPRNFVFPNGYTHYIESNSNLETKAMDRLEELYKKEYKEPEDEKQANEYLDSLLKESQ